MQVPKVLVGFVIGRNGEHINNIQNTCGVRLQFQNGMCLTFKWLSDLGARLLFTDIPGTEFRLTTISGPPENCMRAKEMVEAIVAEVTHRCMCIIHVCLLYGGTLTVVIDFEGGA